MDHVTLSAPASKKPFKIFGLTEIELIRWHVDQYRLN